VRWFNNVIMAGRFNGAVISRDATVTEISICYSHISYGFVLYKLNTVIYAIATASKTTDT